MTKNEVIAFARWLPPPPWRMSARLTEMVNPPAFLRSDVHEWLARLPERVEIGWPTALIITEIPNAPGSMQSLVLIGGQLEHQFDSQAVEGWSAEWTAEWEGSAGVEPDVRSISPRKQDRAIEFLDHNLGKRGKYCVELCSWFGCFESSDTQFLRKRLAKLCAS